MTQKKIWQAGAATVVIALLFGYFQDVTAQAVSCNNSQAESVIPENGKGQALMPREIQENRRLLQKLRISRMDWRDIEDCLKKDEPIVNHVIDYLQYAAALRKIKRDIGAKRNFRIDSSVLWSFDDSFDDSKVELELMAETISTEGALTQVISSPVKWTNVTVGPSFSAQNVEFLSDSAFYKSRFPNRSSLQDSTFHKEVSFQGATFGPNTSFQGVTFRQNAFFRTTSFGRSVSFDEATFAASAIFNFGTEIRRLFLRLTLGTSDLRAEFGPNASFQQVIFSGPVTFDGVIFGRNASFTQSKFHDLASFAEAVLGPEASFAHIKSTGSLSFDDSTFLDGVRFLRAEFGPDTSFRGAVFTGAASFEHASFASPAWFSDATFCGGAAFAHSKSTGNVSFQSAEVRRLLNFSNTNWGARIDFRNSVIEALEWDSHENPSLVEGVFDASDATISNILIRNVRFLDKVDFFDATIGGNGVLNRKETEKRYPCQEVSETSATGDGRNAVFENLIFENAADFSGAKFNDHAIFTRNRFAATWDLTSSTFQKEGTREKAHLCLSRNRMRQFVMEWEHLYGEEFGGSFWSLVPSPSVEESRVRTVSVEENGSLSCADLDAQSEGHDHLAVVYRTLEKSFRKANDRQGENEAWYLAKVAARNSKSPQGQWWVSRWSIWLLLDMPSRHGIDLIRVGIVSVGIMLFFFFIFWAYLRRQLVSLVKLARPPEHTRVLRFRPFEPFMEDNGKRTRPMCPLKDALFLSGRAFLNLGLGSTYPPTRALIIIANVEWLLGIGMLIHFFLAAKNTLPIALPFLT